MTTGRINQVYTPPRETAERRGERTTRTAASTPHVALPPPQWQSERMVRFERASAVFGTEQQHIGHPLVLLPEKVSLHMRQPPTGSARSRGIDSRRPSGATEPWVGRRDSVTAMPNMVSVPFKTHTLPQRSWGISLACSAAVNDARR